MRITPTRFLCGLLLGAFLLGTAAAVPSAVVAATAGPQLSEQEQAEQENSDLWLQDDTSVPKAHYGGSRSHAWSMPARRSGPETAHFNS